MATPGRASLTSPTGSHLTTAQDGLRANAAVEHGCSTSTPASAHASADWSGPTASSLLIQGLPARPGDEWRQQRWKQRARHPPTEATGAVGGGFAASMSGGRTPVLRPRRTRYLRALCSCLAPLKFSARVLCGTCTAVRCTLPTRGWAQRRTRGGPPTRAPMTAGIVGYCLLVFQRRWKPARYEEWLAQALIDLLLEPRP